ncbi:hypothetical protein [Falsiroseomonas sp. HW251]|uniref:hypothetical protein n=1 Tax=Falsiroseomonas sp. HW251 TaxID=3390998 RepID=UPI003D3159F8
MRRAFLAALLLPVAALAQPAPVEIRFPPGTSGTVVASAVARGEVARYSLGARAGQRMALRIESAEDNAVFQVVAPGGKTLPGAGEGDDARGWTGDLPVSGPYVIVVGATRGGAEFRLSVTIR